MDAVDSPEKGERGRDRVGNVEGERRRRCRGGGDEETGGDEGEGFLVG